MHVVYRCPGCRRPVRNEVRQAGEWLKCAECDWSRRVDESLLSKQTPLECLVCGCEDLWRQKDFPPRLGLTVVGLGIVFSTIAWAYYLPELAIGILMLFALADLLLYAFMRDVLVCYRCGARHRRAEIAEDHPPFELETAERYRQESKRLGAG